MEPIFDGGVPLFQNHRALLIGVKDYKNEEINLRFGKIYRPDADVRALKRTLLSIGYPNTKLECLCNEEATFANIRKKLRDLEEEFETPAEFETRGEFETSSKLTLIFWAGHGCQIEGNNYLLPWDANINALASSALSVDEFSSYPTRFPLGHTAIFIDTCFSKGPARARVQFAGSDKLPERVFAFVGASSDEAIENDQGGILFTCLRDGLKGKYQYMTDEKGVVYLSSLAGHLQTLISRKARVAWERAGQGGPTPQQNPQSHIEGNKSIPIGLDCRKYLGGVIVTSRGLPASVKNLATLAIDRYCGYLETQDE